MNSETLNMQEKVRLILFRYRSTRGRYRQCGKTPSELYLNRQIKISLTALRPPAAKDPNEESSAAPQKLACQVKVGERVHARYYTTNKETRKFRVVMKKLGQLHYEVTLDDGYQPTLLTTYQPVKEDWKEDQ
jgi:hypothetical protein